MTGAALAHGATALWDVALATGEREVTPIEQHIHSFLEVLPLPVGYLTGSAAVTAFIALPYGEELLRCARAQTAAARIARTRGRIR
ncbi:hypothetical protein [Kitasatospora sp. NPDC058190]|uniref:hypothetical protein n=1 Tax=Kitasatospora sp. NPDC058190 TaxID=3346371 RepID=UPI0036D9AD65